ncbi:ABC transporter ATP-binding protein [Vibrio splendidus]|uniref:ABC transporter ATP-binding protein n=1 Tax=Vibrio splendidus TaxID=29497 RepID=UPI000C8261F4|nr:ABC transporter ATP-binding protein [Vibrio splendidus]PMI50810.1 sugar ABC transporter ATP-binding protein [Vibrio splendidus]
MSNALEVRNIGKSFKGYSSELLRILSWFGFKFRPCEECRVLNDINFSLAPGEAVGIVGQNGAGKSTLLKMIAGTLKPTKGRIHVSGRISAILELGMGFHPDLTGRQNVYHSAGLMGYTQKQIDLVIDDLEAFAEIGEYFDQPVRTYSSGMQMRVAFGVVTAYRPEILIVDEALSVGDAYFQHKSLNRIREFQKHGTTLIFVSHDRGAIQAICDRAILLEQGSVIKDGNPEDVMDYYNALIANKENNTITQTLNENGKVETVSGTGEVSIEKIQLSNIDIEHLEYVSVGEPVTLKISVSIIEDIPELVLGYMIKDRLGQPIFGTNTYHYDKPIKNVKKGETYDFSFSFAMNLGVGSYSISVSAHSGATHLSANYEWRDQALVFSIVNSSKEGFVGSSWLDQKVEIESH